MTNTNIVHAVSDGFFATLDEERMLSPNIIEALKSLAEEGKLSDEGAIEAALESDIGSEDETEDA